MSTASAVPDVAERQDVADLLTRYCQAVDGADLDGVCALFGDATVDFRGRRVNGPALREVYAGAFASGTHTAHCISNLFVTDRAATAGPSPQLAYQATYQRYHLGDGPPLLAAIGFYRGTVTHSATGITWLTHEVRATP